VYQERKMAQKSHNINISDTLTYQPEIYSLVNKPDTPRFAYQIITAIEDKDPVDVVNFMEELTHRLNVLTRRLLTEKAEAKHLEIPIGAEPGWYPDEEDE
tara:strand:+ start:1249 stop:1548 length:300 start_codon:yes stop_codon:yes gene_type:complete